MPNWKEMLIHAFKSSGDDITKMKTTLTEEELTKEFDSGYGLIEGLSFTAWGEKYVYFPATYDGLEWVAYAPREVCDIKTDHIGG